MQLSWDKLRNRAGSLWEAAGGRAADAPTVTVESAVDRMVRAERHRSLIAALDAVGRQWKSDGKPHRFTP